MISYSVHLHNGQYLLFEWLNLCEMSGEGRDLENLHVGRKMH